MNSKLLVVCGDSFTSSSSQIYNTFAGIDWPKFSVAEHQDLFGISNTIREEIKIKYNIKHNPNFTEIIASRKNWDIINFSLPGCSNLLIRQQIDKAISFKPTYVIFSGTDVARFLYRESSTANMITCHDKKIIKIYQKLFYDEEIAIAQTKYLLSNAMDTLEKNKIPYLFIPGPPMLREIEWEQKGIIYPNNYPQMWELPYKMKEDIAPYQNHNNWENHLKLAESCLELIKEWN